LPALLRAAQFELWRGQHATAVIQFFFRGNSQRVLPNCFHSNVCSLLSPGARASTRLSFQHPLFRLFVIEKNASVLWNGMIALGSTGASRVSRDAFSSFRILHDSLVFYKHDKGTERELK
jgi:hypothetical protein